MMMRTVLLASGALCAGTLFVAGTDRGPAEPSLRSPDALQMSHIPAPPDPPSLPTGTMSSPEAGFITAEAHVFRRVADRITLAAQARRRANAHPRSLAGFRALRAYPGAPPRVPHGLAADELRGSLCNTCHLRGGFSPRFGAYVPLTPHPELQNCLQCHAMNADLVELPAIGDRPDARCRQCHRPGDNAAMEELLDWRPADWPQLAAADATGAPPVIPHDVQLRGDCAACHSGPGAVAEIRTRHPERTSCRQCHMENGESRGVPSDGEGGSP